MRYYMRVFSVRSVPTDPDDPGDWDLGEHKIINVPIDTIALLRLVADDLPAAQEQARAFWLERFSDSDVVDGYWIYDAYGKPLVTEYPHVSEILEARKDNIPDPSLG
jgi:hypothetical protein